MLKWMRLLGRNIFCLLLSIIMANAVSADSEGHGDQHQPIMLFNVTVIDGTGAPARKGQAVLVDDARIAAIGAVDTIRKQYGRQLREIDLKGGYILPGLWNNHSHLSDLLPDPKNILATEDVLSATIRSGRNAIDALKAGFTSLRMAAERDYIDVAWNNAFKAGVFVGPRIVPSGRAVTTIDGHGSEGGTDHFVIETSGAAAVRQAIRENVGKGAEIIKLMVDNMSEAELKAGIDAAHEAGVKVIGHAAEPAAGLAVELGIDGIEHGYFLTDETIQLMAEKGVFYDPTIVCNLSADYISEREALIKKAGYESSADTVEGRILVAYADERDDSFAEKQRSILQKAAKAGVKIITGSDSNPISEIGILEIEQQVFSGLSPMQAIVAATRNSADMVGMLEEVGTIEKGKIADLIVLSKDPLANISNLRSLQMVFRNGKPVSLHQNEGQKSFWDLYFLGE